MSLIHDTLLLAHPPSTLNKRRQQLSIQSGTVALVVSAKLIGTTSSFSIGHFKKTSTSTKIPSIF